MKGILDNLQTQRDMYKIEQTKYCWGIANVMMEHNCDDESVRRILSLSDETIKEIRDSFCKEDRILLNSGE